ncbi:MAG: peptide ABC transporter substrate-binding protein [Sinimarinibacterium sp.]|jgi:ABC-type oligopeptide transport system substrate-binding subunit
MTGARRRDRWAARSALLALSLLGADTAHAGGTLRIGNGPEPETLDPQRAEGVSAGNILRDLYEGLTAIAADGRPMPAAARGWVISADGRTYTFQLRDAARWSNGDALTADDFVAGLRRSVAPATGSAFAQLLRPIRHAVDVLEGRLPPEQLGVHALAPRVLQIELEAPAPQLLGLLSHQSTFPIHGPSLRAHGDGFARPGRLVSNGAYRLQNWIVQSQVDLARNPFYWNAARTAIDAVRYVATEDIHSEFKRYRAGELDVTYEIPPAQAQQIRRDFAGQLHLAPYLGVYFYGLNLTRAPFRDRPQLRQALSMVIDREVIAAKVLNGLALPAYGWIPPGTAQHRAQQPDWADWPYDRRVERARELYRAAGYSDTAPLDVEIRYNTHESHRRVATVVAAMWKQALGVRTRLLNEEFKVFLYKRRLRRDTQVFRAAWMADFNDPSSFLGILHSAHGKNDSGWADAAYDALLEHAAATADAGARAELLAQAEAKVLADAPVIPIYFYVSKHLVHPRVRGWTDNVLDYHYSKDLSLN